MKPTKPKPLKPMTRYCFVTRKGTLAKGSDGMVLNYESKEVADYDVAAKDGERVALVEMREVKRG